MDIDTNMLLASLSNDEFGVLCKESSIKDVQDKINELGKEIKELNKQYSDLVNYVDSSKNEFRNVEIVVNAINEFKSYFNCIKDFYKRKFMLGVIIDKIS